MTTPTPSRLILRGRHFSKVLMGLLALMVMVSATIGIVFDRKADHDRGVSEARTRAAAVGTRSVSQLFSYDYRTIPEALEDRLRLLTPSFASEYRKLVTKTVQPAAVRDRLTTRTDVVSASVIRADASTVHLLMFLNQTSAKQGSSRPILTGSRVLVVMRSVRGTWKVESVDPV